MEKYNRLRCHKSISSITISFSCISSCISAIILATKFRSLYRSAPAWRLGLPPILGLPDVDNFRLVGGRAEAEQSTRRRFLHPRIRLKPPAGRVVSAFPKSIETRVSFFHADEVFRPSPPRESHASKETPSAIFLCSRSHSFFYFSSSSWSVR